ncbi:hypothetical protein DFH08DRAFT_890124 [Mycena albidolilacea]|uniref:F-box domain-containing protein n=1 Tax=Mycena albidolilacea TaxID=1033008 RepID=A0AAD6ZEW1_9AGAR|nr:hypothetical protein DFH08DRAFT_890124 [Mycena albidolilacea]
MRLHELRQRLSNLNATISHHESIFQELKQKRSTILSELNLVVYPVLTLPPEITAEIFKWCIDTGKRLLPSLAPSLLTQICRDWRALALSTPALWDTITEIRLEGHDQALQMERLVTTWFSRAGTRPLSLGIISELVPLESVIRRCASQLQSLVMITDYGVLSDFNAIQSFPLLRDLDLCCLGSYEPDGGQIQLFDSAPSLRHLSLESVPPWAVAMPWAQLTKITISSTSLRDCLNVLRWATSLHEFRRQDSPEDEEEDMLPLEPPVHHSTLNSLAVSISGGDENILRFLVLPGLQKFELEKRFMIWESYLDAEIVPFLSGISGTLRTFNVGMSPTVPVHWFYSLTHLTTLELVRSMGLIRALDRRTTPDFLPKLQAFVFLGCGSDQVDNELLDTLASRCDARDAAHAKLESFSLIWPRYYKSETPVVRLPLVNVLPLRALAARGIHIHIGTREQNSFY